MSSRTLLKSVFLFYYRETLIYKTKDYNEGYSIDSYMDHEDTISDSNLFFNLEWQWRKSMMLI